ncbi:relaxase/mobilization nuclease domain-containing protein [Mucilaginibacter segetis]|uniref:Relaxase/mobilization nuclease domain-containing protein n=1 Tax=Mucilaginibacter segetis TaxID=2793071 RepID=A0A934PS97_9SPHI|nr:relaxase/mobilization nuclease domain-containing protein [Mucilaginibacter segetis]MBK0378552.1 relaxase/mobilization nuclease domain-containing protein [Mucilaginibacter segetis]
MVAKIKTGRSILGAINYNEHKVRAGKAELIWAQGYLKDPADLTFQDKMRRLTDLINRNARTQVNTLHVSLNFAVGENLDKDTLQQISDDYMQGLGFGKQPYLVYQHYDAGHAHLHIVSTNIEPDGKRISFHHLANRASESARKKIEQTYQLVKAEDQVEAVKFNIKPLEKLVYGKAELKRSMTNIVNEVIGTYKFTSVPELNAVLNQYNITADRGSKDSRMFEKNGLVYWALDEKGNKLGVPVKASSIYGKPTLQKLQDRFRLNEVVRRPLKDRLRQSIDEVLADRVSKSQFQKALLKKHIHVVFRQNEEGRIYGVTFVDHQHKAVFNGSDLGKNYAANALTAGFVNEPVKGSLEKSPKRAERLEYGNREHTGSSEMSQTLFDILFKEEQQDLAALGRLQQRKRKKKRKGHSL